MTAGPRETELDEMLRRRREFYGLPPEPAVWPTLAEERAAQTAGAQQVTAAAVRDLGGTRAGDDAIRRWFSRPTHERDMPEFAVATIAAHCWTADEAYDLLGTAWQMPEWPGQTPKRSWRRAFTTVTGGRVMCEVRDDGHDCSVHDAPVTVYRGSFASTKRGLSWTLDRERAEWFAARGDMTGSGRTMRVWTTVVPPERVWAHFVSRGENELVCDIAGLRVTEAPDAPAPGTRVQHDPFEDEWWIVCGQGHTHYGEHGAAGLLLRSRDETGQTVWWLQQRGRYVDHPGTYSTPGGAIRAGETPAAAAAREAAEEVGMLAGADPTLVVTDDHGGWTYSTVIVDLPQPVPPEVTVDGNGEHAGGDWFTRAQIAGLPLHPGFAATLAATIDAGAP